MTKVIVLPGINVLYLITFEYFDCVTTGRPECVFTIRFRQLSKIKKGIITFYIMSFKITQACINCAACEAECPFEAISPGGVNWRISQNKYLHFCHDNEFKDEFYSDVHYYIIPDECNECKGIAEFPKCLLVCPVKGIVLDNFEPEEHLYSKKAYLEKLHPWRSWT